MAATTLCRPVALTYRQRQVCACHNVRPGEHETAQRQLCCGGHRSHHVEWGKHCCTGKATNVRLGKVGYQKLPSKRSQAKHWHLPDKKSEPLLVRGSAKSGRPGRARLVRTVLHPKVAQLKLGGGGLGDGGGLGGGGDGDGGDGLGGVGGGGDGGGGLQQ